MSGTAIKAIEESIEYQIGYSEGYKKAQMVYLEEFVRIASLAIKPPFQIIIKAEI